MANLHLVTGFAGQEHIKATDQGAFNAALIGRDQFVLDVGNVLEAQIISNNQIRILDGELMMQGRFVRLDPGTYVDLLIDNGTTGMKRNDLIVVRYTKDTMSGVEAANLVVLKGTPVESDPVDPAYTEGNLADGSAVVHDFPLWRIPLDGLNVGTPEALFGEPFMDSMRTLPAIRKAVENIHSEVDEKIAGLEEYTKKEVLTNETKAAYGLDADAVPDDIFANILNKFGDGMRTVAGSYVGSGKAVVSLTFPAPVKFLLIYPGTGIAWVSTSGKDFALKEGTLWVDGSTLAHAAYVYSGGPSYALAALTCEKSNDGKTLTLTGSVTTYAAAGIDNGNQNYNYFAICGGE